MKIVLAVEGAKGKNVVFVSDTLQTYSLEEAVRLAQKGQLESIYAVSGRGGNYLRTSRSISNQEQLERLSISSYQLFASTNDIRHAVSTPAFSRYLQLYAHSLEKDGGPLIVIEGTVTTTKEAVKMKLQSHQTIIFDAGKKFNIDPYLLGAIVIDEIARIAPWEFITDPLLGYFIGINASVGIAQVKLETARGLIKGGYYNPNPADSKLLPENIARTSRMYLYQYVKEPKHSIFFAAAQMRSLIVEWKTLQDISKQPEIIATLYSLKGKTPHKNPEANERGLQIAGEFYELAKMWLV